MHLIRNSAFNELFPAVEIDIWEGFLLRNRTNLYKTLCTYSLDNGPLNEPVDGKLLFRFTAFDWQKNVQRLLVRHNIHYSIAGKVKVNPAEQLLKKKIYIAEDDPDILYTLSTMLADAGYHVKVSSNGKPVLDGSFSRIDLFILDKLMPDVNGLDICRHLRSQSATKDIPVIMISAHPKSGNEALHAGATDYIEKPFEMHYLLNVVAKYTKD
jgi:two-component system, OmpR family, phosphate regulon response regulator PhoB